MSKQEYNNLRLSQAGNYINERLNERIMKNQLYDQDHLISQTPNYNEANINQEANYSTEEYIKRALCEKQHTKNYILNNATFMSKIILDFIAVF